MQLQHPTIVSKGKRKEKLRKKIKNSDGCAQIFETLEGRRKRYFCALFLERDGQKKLGPTALGTQVFGFPVQALTN